MCAKFGSSSTTRTQRVLNGALLRSSLNRGMSTSAISGAGAAVATLGAGATLSIFIGSIGVSPGSVYCCGKTSVNTLPCPGSLVTLIEPILNPLWVWIFWREPVGPATWLGGGLILSGLLLKTLTDALPRWKRRGANPV